ncbi:MAG: nucleoside-triphosphatase, partial [Planctomycetota bacterium]
LTDAELFFIDEIGKMECFSRLFVAIVDKLLQSDRSVLATVAQKGGGFIGRVKEYAGINLITLTRNRQDEVVDEILDLLRLKVR